MCPIWPRFLWDSSPSPVSFGACGARGGTLSTPRACTGQPTTTARARRLVASRIATGAPQRGGARTDTFDSSARKAISINAASHVRHIPAYFRLDRRPLFLAWLAERGLDPDGPSEPPFSVDAEASRTPTKWPKEVKPSLSAVMQDNAVFNRAARRLSTAVFAIGDDAADYFNQLFMATP